MTNISPKRRVMAALLGGKIDRVPATSLAGCGGTVCVDMQKATGIFSPSALRDAEKMAKLAVASYKLTGLECVRVPYDFVEEAEALGCEIKWYDNPEGLPAVKGHPYEKPEDLKVPENFLGEGRIPVVLEAIKIARAEVGDFLPISSLAVGPLTLAGELVGLQRILKWIILKPNYVKDFVNITTDIVIKYAKAQYQAGSDIVQVAEPMASGEMISPAMFKEFVKPFLTKIADDLDGIRILHICGRAEKIIADMAETGFDGLSIEVKDVASIKPLVGDVKILGNVSSKDVLVFGSSEDVKAQAKRALEAGVDLLEPSCGISPNTPLANVKALVDAAKEFQ